MSKALNEATGGNDYKSGAVDLNPAQIEYIAEAYFGGVGKFLNQTYKTVQMLTGEAEYDIRNVPIVNRFFAESKIV